MAWFCPIVNHNIYERTVGSYGITLAQSPDNIAPVGRIITIGQ